MMGFLEGTFGAELAPTMYWVLLGIVALVGLFLVWWLISLFRRPRYGSSSRRGQARLAVTDAASVDQRRKLVLLRRDDVEHLIMIGGPTDIIIESGIQRGDAKTASHPTAAGENAAQSKAASTAQSVAAPQPPTRGDRREPSAAAAPAYAPMRREQTANPPSSPPAASRPVSPTPAVSKPAPTANAETKRAEGPAAAPSIAGNAPTRPSTAATSSEKPVTSAKPEASDNAASAQKKSDLDDEMSREIQSLIDGGSKPGSQT